MSRVRDGSTGKYGNGYHTLGVVALTPEKKMPIGIYTRVYSPSENGFVSEDCEVLKAFARCKTGIAHMLHKKPKPLQTSLFPDVGFGWS